MKFIRVFFYSSSFFLNILRNFCFQEQPLLLEELVEQEKREQERHAASNMANEIATQPNVSGANSGLLSDHDFERLRADVMNVPPQAIPAQGLLPIQQQNQQQQPQQMPNVGNQMPFNQPNQPIRHQFIAPEMNQPVQHQQHQQQQQQWKPSPMQMQPNVNQMNANVTSISFEGTTVKKEG